MKHHDTHIQAYQCAAEIAQSAMAIGYLCGKLPHDDNVAKQIHDEATVMMNTIGDLLVFIGAEM